MKITHRTIKGQNRRALFDIKVYNFTSNERRTSSKRNCYKQMTRMFYLHVGRHRKTCRRTAGYCQHRGRNLRIFRPLMKARGCGNIHAGFRTFVQTTMVHSILKHTILEHAEIRIYITFDIFWCHMFYCRLGKCLSTIRGFSQKHVMFLINCHKSKC